LVERLHGMQEVRGFDSHRLHREEAGEGILSDRSVGPTGAPREPEGSQLGLSGYLANGPFVRLAGQATV
jgi:hypothetical protein